MHEQIASLRPSTSSTLSAQATPRTWCRLDESKKGGLSLLIWVSMFHLMMLSNWVNCQRINVSMFQFVVMSSYQLGQLSEKVWVNSIHFAYY